MTLDVAIAAAKSLDRQRLKPHFGNAKAVQSLLNQAVMAAGTRQQLTLRDFGVDPSASVDPWQAVRGCNTSMKQLCERVEASVKSARQLGQDPMQSLPLMLRFEGPPGSGLWIFSNTVFLTQVLFWFDLNVRQNDVCESVRSVSGCVEFAHTRCCGGEKCL